MKKTNKTVLSIGLAILGAVAVFGSTACGETKNKSAVTSHDPSSSAVSENSNVNSDYKKSSDISSSSETSNSSSESSNVEISKVVYDKNGIKITYKGLENSYNITTKLNFLIENNNSETYTVQTTDVSIDGFTYSTLMSTKVASNKKATDSIVVLDSTLKENNTSYENIKEAEIGLTIWGESNVLDHIKDKISFTIQ